MNSELDHRLFDPAAVTADTRAFMERFDVAMRGVPTALNTPITVLREARASGKAALPIVRLPNGISDSIAGPAGPIALRIFKPERARGAYLHFHGGGFVMGAPDQFDALLNRFAEGTGMTVVSAGYRLAPEHPFPAAPDDCIASARWFLQQADAGAFGDGGLAIGGESAGAYLAVTTLLRLRDVGVTGRFDAALLTSGAYDMSLTPSARNWGDRYALISTPILRKYLEMFLPRDVDPTSPQVSPLYANLSGMPPALFVVGTQDPLLDDSLFMAQRWRAAGSPAELRVYAGGIHGFNAFPMDIAGQAHVEQVEFITAASAEHREAEETRRKK